MRRHKRSYVVLVAVAALVATTVAWAGGREARWRGDGLRRMGLKIYWSLLRDDQKAPAKEILADFLVDTAPDRLHAAARLTEYRAQVAAVLTPEQRREAWQVGRHLKGLSRDQRRELAERLLAKTDRALLARRVERALEGSAAEQAVLAFQIANQVYEVVEPELARRLALTEDQRVRIRFAFDALYADLQPTAARLARARAEAVEKALGLLDAEQRAKVEVWKDDVTEKVLDFLRGA